MGWVDVKDTFIWLLMKVFPKASINADKIFRWTFHFPTQYSFQVSKTDFVKFFTEIHVYYYCVGKWKVHLNILSAFIEAFGKTFISNHIKVSLTSTASEQNFKAKVNELLLSSLTLSFIICVVTAFMVWLTWNQWVSYHWRSNTWNYVVKFVFYHFILIVFWIEMWKYPLHFSLRS